MNIINTDHEGVCLCCMQTMHDRLFFLYTIVHIIDRIAYFYNLAYYIQPIKYNAKNENKEMW